MEIPKSVFLLFCLFGELFGFILFLQGFLPFRSSIPGYSTFLDVPKEPSNNDFQPKNIDQYIHTLEMKNWQKETPNVKKKFTDEEAPVPTIEPVIGRVVIMLIDGLREDFMFGPKGTDHMKFTRNLIDKGQARSFVARAHPPTVTMPRIKAVTSGTIPGFMDVVFNLKSDKLDEDNIVSQLYRNDKSIYFFGDDTWLRLFPDHFKIKDGTTSFYVSDYTEVDNNVTRHLPVTLADKKWDVLILHYLGLDHIGHLGGPHTPLIGHKLEEMDEIIQEIYEGLNKGTPTHLPSLFIVCGDHGMSEVGSHGGASIHEVSTPLVFLSEAFNSVTDEVDAFPEIQQIDLAATLSLLIGIPIPMNSLGGVITELVEDLLPPRETLRAMQVNSHQLACVLYKNVANVRNEPSFELYIQALRLHSRWLSLHRNGTHGPLDSLTDKVMDYYSRAQTAMQDRISSSLAKYDTFAMICGIVLLCQVFLLSYYATYQSTTTPTTGIHFYPVVVGNFFSIFICCCIVVVTGYFVICTTPGGRNSDLLCSLSFVPLLRSMVGVLLCSSFATLLLSYLLRKPFTRLGHISPFESLGAKGLVTGTVIHSISLLSSSFDEEEHQTWYFLTTTLLLLVLLELISVLVKEDSEQKMSWRILFITVSCLILFRIQRSWNQTGIQWAHMPDVADWFMSPDHRLYLTALMVISVLVIYLFQLLEHSQLSIFLAAGLIGAVLYRNATGGIDLMVSLPSSSKGINEAWFTYAMSLVLLVRAILSFIGVWSPDEDDDSDDESADIMMDLLPEGANPWTGRPSRASTDLFHSILVLIVLLLRPHNVAVVAVTVTLQHCIVVYLLPWLQWSPWKMTLLFVWLGQSTFYAQGNSNSAATVDISAGYVGLESHHLIMAAVLTSLATFSGPCIWLVRLVMCFSNRYSSRYYHSLQEVCFTLLLCRALPVAVYTFLVFIQRYHLFIWSVFSPKLLYEGSHTLVVSLVLIILQINLVLVQYFQIQEKGPAKTI